MIKEDTAYSELQKTAEREAFYDALDKQQKDVQKYLNLLFLPSSDPLAKPLKSRLKKNIESRVFYLRNNLEKHETLTFFPDFGNI
jgi:hypothetical protein